MTGAQFLGAAQEARASRTSTSRDGDYWQVGVCPVQRDDGLDAFFLRHDDVGDDQVGPVLLVPFNALGAATVARITQGAPTWPL